MVTTTKKASVKKITTVRKKKAPPVVMVDLGQIMKCLDLNKPPKRKVVKKSTTTRTRAKTAATTRTRTKRKVVKKAPICLPPPIKAPTCPPSTKKTTFPRASTRTVGPTRTLAPKQAGKGKNIFGFGDCCTVVQKKNKNMNGNFPPLLGLLALIPAVSAASIATGSTIAAGTLGAAAGLSTLIKNARN